MTEKLAIDGGAPVLKGRLPLLLYNLRYGAARSLDLARALPTTLRGVTTLATGEGIVKKFEDSFRKLTGARYALAMNNGTATLHSAYVAVGVGPGTEVIVPSYTWHASATPVLLCGAVPVFCEVDPRTLTLDPDDFERRITERTRAVCVVHIWGNPAEMDRIRAIADRHDVAVIEDCSHAHGAVYKRKSVGTWGHVGCFSLQGSKAVEGGEAGVAVTDDPELYDRMLLLGHNGRVPREQKADSFDVGNLSLGAKYRPHLLGMYWAHASLQRLPRRNQRATRVWEILCEELRGVAGIRPIEGLPGAVRGGFYAFVLDYEGAELGGPGTEAFVEAVRAEGAPLDTDQFRGTLLHTLPLFTSMDRRKLGGGLYDPTRPWEENLWQAPLPITERVGERLVRFPPILYGLKESYVRDCARAVKKVLATRLPASAGADRSPASPPAAEPPLASTGR